MPNKNTSFLRNLSMNSTIILQEKYTNRNYESALELTEKNNNKHTYKRKGKDIFVKGELNRKKRKSNTIYDKVLPLKEVFS
jgi:hypothetical protein